MTVMVAEDRSMCVQPNQVVRTAWVDIDLCRLSFRLPMSPEAVEKKYRRLLNLGECAPWPPIVGHWEYGRFVVCDGRHDYLTALVHRHPRSASRAKVGIFMALYGRKRQCLSNPNSGKCI